MTLTIPKELKDLPIAKILPTLDINSDMILIGMTGSGKTMLIPPIISDTRKRLVVVRQPTRAIAKLVYQALNNFFGSQLTIGIITSEDELDYRYINSFNILIITDGILNTIIKRLDTSRLVLIFDESHWGSPAFEIELAIAESYKSKNPSMQIVLLSATISPYLYVSYFERTSATPIKDSVIRDTCQLSNSEKINTTIQNQRLKIFYSEGIVYPITKEMIRIPDINDVDSEISKFCYHMKEVKDFGIVFQATRAEIIESHRKYGYILPTLYFHADSSVDDLLKFFKDNTSGTVFATISLSTSITLPFLETLIIDKTNGSEYIESIEQKISKYGIYCDHNEILQKCGRVGRTRPGKATLITSRDISWSDIVPTSIIPPLKKELPISAALISAAHGIDISKAQLLSVLSPSQISKSLEKLKRYKFIDDAGLITSLGKRALALPLEPEDAKILLSTPSSFIPATAAYLSFPHGMFYLVDSSSSPKLRASLYSNYTFNSISISKISILQDAIINKSNLKSWCHDNALNYKRITMAMFTFHQIAKKFSQTPNEFDDALLSLDFSPDSTITNSYRTLIYMLQPKFPALLDGSGFGIHDGIKKHYSFFSDLEFFHVEYPNAVYKVSARFSLFQAKGKPDIYGRLSDATIPLSLGARVTA